MVRIGRASWSTLVFGIAVVVSPPIPDVQPTTRAAPIGQETPRAPNDSGPAPGDDTPEGKAAPSEPTGDAGAVPEGIPVTTELPDLIDAHNRIRSEHDLPPLQPDATLSEAARTHVLDMAANDFLAHEGSDGSLPGERATRQGYRYRKIAENVAQGYRSIDALMEGWMESPHHRENILGEFEEIGAARAADRDGQPYWTVVFGTAWPQPEPDAAAQNLVDAINARRSEAGEPPLRVDPLLQDVAMQRARENAERSRLGEQGSNGGNPLEEVARRGYRFRNLALVNAAGQPGAAEVVESWTENGNSRVDLLGNFQDVGAGYATDESGRPYWTILLGRPLPTRN